MEKKFLPNVHPPLLFVLFYSANHPLFSSFIPRLTNLVPLTKIISAYGLLHSYQSWSQISFIFMSVLLYLLLPSFLCVVAKSLPCFCLSQCTRAVEETSTFIVHKTPFSSKSTALKLRPTSVRPSHPTAVEDIMPIRVGASSHWIVGPIAKGPGDGVSGWLRGHRISLQCMVIVSRLNV